MTGLVFKLDGKVRCALTGKLVTDDQSEYAERCGSRRVYCDGRLGVRKFDRLYPKWKNEPYDDKQGNWKQAWLYYVKGNRQNVCAITDKPFQGSSEERWEDVRAKRMQEVAKRQGSVYIAKKEGTLGAGKMYGNCLFEAGASYSLTIVVLLGIGC